MLGKPRSFGSKYSVIIGKYKKHNNNKMPGKDTIYSTKQQMERFIELYQGEENLWHIGSPDYQKKNKKNDSLEKMKLKFRRRIQGLVFIIFATFSSILLRFINLSIGGK